MTVYGYARVSTVEQHLEARLEARLEAQVDALVAAGVEREHVFTDTVRGAKDSRPGLDALLAVLAPGDVVTVCRLDRLGRSTAQLIRQVQDWQEAGVHFCSLTDDLDTSAPTGRHVCAVIAALAQLERDRTAERTAVALEAARRSDKPLGRPSKVTWEQYQLAHQLAAQGASHETIHRSVGLSRGVVGRVLRDEIESLAPFKQRRLADMPDDSTLLA